MLTEKKIILFGAGIFGRKALRYFGNENVYCFADNKKAGQTFLDKRVISFNELQIIQHDYNIVISVNAENTESIATQCKSSDISYCHVYDLITHECYESNPIIHQFRNKHKGERCFLVGNGPSLLAADLSKLHEYGEISFGCNAIWNIFSQTSWRPDYYQVVDYMFFLLQNEMLANIETNYKFFPVLDDYFEEDSKDKKRQLEQGKGQVFFLQTITYAQQDKPLRFSSDASRAIYAYNTVMYSMIQLAVYMGFTEIYLIGVDGGSGVMKNSEDYLSQKRHFYTEDANLVRRNSFHMAPTNATEKDIAFRLAKDYRQAGEYTRKYGVKILNATRGGVVEAFERVDFDSLF